MPTLIFETSHFQLFTWKIDQMFRFLAWKPNDSSKDYEDTYGLKIALFYRVFSFVVHP